MIGNITQNIDFYGTTAYVLGKSGSRIIGSNMVGESVSDLAQEFKLSLALKPGIKRPVFHASLSLSLADELSDQKFAELAKDYLREMGFDPIEHQYVVALHTDTQHRHVHIVASRINVRSGQLVSDSYQRYRSQAVIRQLERTYKLTLLKSSWEKNQLQQQYAHEIGGLVRQIWLWLEQPPKIAGRHYRVEFSPRSQTLRVYRHEEDQVILEIKNALEKPTVKRTSEIKEADYKYFATIVAQSRTRTQQTQQR